MGAGCSASPSADDAGVVEDAAAAQDAARDASDAGAGASDAGPPTDAGRSLVDPTRPYGYRTLHPACGAWAYDLDDSATYDTTGELAVAMMDARCRRDLRCGEGGRTSTCDPFVVQSPAETLHAPPDVVDARACLVALETAGCTWDDQLVAEATCRALSRYGAPDGSACSADRFCRSGHCEGASAACGGTCTPPPTCTPSCTADEVCVAGACMPRPGEGQPCASAAALCGAGLVCYAGVCVRASQAGDPCMTSEPFPGVISYSCLSETVVCDTATHLCVEPRQVAVGAACDDLLTRCAPGVDCLGTCVARPGLGMACRADRICAPGLACSASFVCAPVVGPGCDCSDGSACPFGFRCADGVCGRIGIVPTTCSSFVDCDGAPCSRGACSVVHLGNACAQDGPSCAEGHCRPLVRGTCAPTVPSGASCAEDPYGCGAGETCVDWRTCGIAADQTNPCTPGWP